MFQTSTEVVSDAYGFEIEVTPHELGHRLDCEKKAEQREERWRKYERSRQLPGGKTLKRLVRKGVPMELRAWLWMETSGARKKRERYPSSYFRIIIQPDQAPCRKQIELDTPRTFPSHSWLQSDEGQAKLFNVLLAYSRHNPDVGYCQGMNYIAGILLLVLNKDEENVFWLMTSLIDDILYPGTYSHNLKGCQVEMRSLGDLVRVKLPKLSAHLEELSCDISIIATDWFLCLFCTSVPVETVVRIWDTLFHEGPKVLFRVSLSILRLAQDGLMQVDNAGELLKKVKEVTKHLHHRDQLVDVAFNGVGSMPMATIAKSRKHQAVVVDAEMARREERLQRISHDSSQVSTPTTPQFKKMASSLLDSIQAIVVRDADEDAVWHSASRRRW